MGLNWHAEYIVHIMSHNRQTVLRKFTVTYWNDFVVRENRGFVMQYQTRNFQQDTPEELYVEPVVSHPNQTMATMGNQFRQEQLQTKATHGESEVDTNPLSTGSFFQSQGGLEHLFDMKEPEPQEMTVALPFDIIGLLMRTANDSTQEKQESVDTNMLPIQKPMVLPVANAKNEKFQKAWEKLHKWTMAQRVHGERIYPSIQKKLQQDGITGKISAIKTQISQTDKSTKEGRIKRRQLQKQKKGLMKKRMKVINSFVKGKSFGAKQAVAAFAKGKRSDKAFFKAFWGRKCYQFANRLLGYYHNGKGQSVYQMQSMAKKASESDASSLEDMKQRDTSYRGFTLAELGAVPDLTPGVAVHVKIQFDQDRPYHTPDDFHHWVTYIGNGLFSDSKHPVATGAKIDDFLKKWVTRTFHLNVKGSRFGHLHNETYATADSLAKKEKNSKTRLKPKADLQSRVTAVYNPTAAKAKQ